MSLVSTATSLILAQNDRCINFLTTYQFIDIELPRSLSCVSYCISYCENICKKYTSVGREVFIKKLEIVNNVSRSYLINLI